MQWEVVIGLETHVQLSTRSKIFSGAARHFGISTTQVDSWVAFEKAGCRELYDPAYTSPEITEKLLQSIFFDLDNGLSLLQACIKYGFKRVWKFLWAPPLG